MIVAGFGFRRGTGIASLRAALALARQGQSAVTHLATASDKVAALMPLAECLGLSVRGLSPEELSGVVTRTRSAASLAARATGSLAEASALCAAGPGARLLGPRHISPDRMATCALAEGFLS
ncbi:cobalamin biosynthesis protein [Novosphingobium subterraneum]|uniref:cobalamin biosynthesis protein n=1 Tax=Novosphingobium subterraneum TaxID=48936 RepID=UPI0010F8FB47